MKWGEIIKKNFFESFVRIAEVYFFNFQEGVITFAFFRWANLASYSITCTKIEPPDLGRGHIDIIRSRQIVIIRCAEKSKTVWQCFQNTCSINDTFAPCLCLQQSEKQFLSAHAVGIFNVILTGNFYKRIYIFFLKFNQIECIRFGNNFVIVFCIIPIAIIRTAF